MFHVKQSALDAAAARLNELSASPSHLRRYGMRVAQNGEARTAASLLGHPDIQFTDLVRVWPELADIPETVSIHLVTAFRYAGYLNRQGADIRAYREDESLILPDTIDYGAIGGLSTEMREKLGRTRPATLGAAARIPGVTPAALTALLHHVRRPDRRIRA